MTKFLSKWFRTFQRWIAVPTALLIPIAAIIKLVGSPRMAVAQERPGKIPFTSILNATISKVYD